MGDLSAHFSRSEFRDHRTGELVGPSVRLLEILEALRAEINAPIRIVSGYRSEATNKAVGGRRRSYHLWGRAADLPTGLVRPKQALRSGAGGVGVCNGWVVHIDDRNVRPPLIFDDC